MMDFHIHSDYSDDGVSSIDEIVEGALAVNLRTIAIVDHVRGTPKWIHERNAEILRARTLLRGRLDIYAGAEARLVDVTGTIDVSKEVMAAVDFVVASIHRIPNGAEDGLECGDSTGPIRFWFDGTKSLADRVSADVIGHPERALIERGVVPTPDLLSRLAERIEFSRVFVELNSLSEYPGQLLHTEIMKRRPDSLVFASDAHSVGDLKRIHGQIGSVERRIVDLGNASFDRMLASRIQKTQMAIGKC